MINKKSLWFLTLFSLILVLSVYYVTMPSDLLLTTNSDININNKDSNNEEPVVEIKESEILVALRVESDEQLEVELNELKEVLNDTKASVEDKNNAYEQMKNINNTRSEEKNLEQNILNEYNLKSFVKIDGDQIRVVIDSSEHNVEVANNVIRLIQSNYETNKYITVKFQS